MPTDPYGYPSETREAYADENWLMEEKKAYGHGEVMDLMKPVQRFTLRRGGSSDFVSRIRDGIEYVSGWNNPAALVFDDEMAARIAKAVVLEFDGVTICLEPVPVAEDRQEKEGER